MIVRNHTKSFISMMITELNQHFIILEKSGMRKQNVSYHEYNDSISFKTEFCTHIKVFEFSFSKQSLSSKNKIETLINEFKSFKILKQNKTFNVSGRKQLNELKTSLSSIKMKKLTEKKFEMSYSTNECDMTIKRRIQKGLTSIKL